MRPLAAVCLSLHLLAAEAPIRGFPPDQQDKQGRLEQRARSIPDARRVREYMERMSAEPHHAGSPGSKAVAEYALGLFREWGFDARIETFEALLPYPTRRSLELLAPARFKAGLQEPPIAEDPDSGDAGQIPTYNAYSASGTVTAPLVYVNYGVPDDYEYLKKQGVDVKGKIAIARYGQSWRGIKPKVAHENGAVGCIIYSDPSDDGYFQGDVYPKGALRPPRGVQRGSVMDMPLYVGDPLSPGWASEKGSERLPLSQAKTVMKIPVLPISYEDARPLLENLEGPVAPEEWRGALPITYHIGPGPATVHLEVDSDWATRPIYNVIAIIRGGQFPDQWVVYGNHHDAWVNGAHDPVSGAAALLETARSLAELTKSGWRPARTVVFALWDAEEFGIVGSTEWVEKHVAELGRKAVAYLNSDTNGKGTIRGGGSLSLEQFIHDVLRDVADPVTAKSLLETSMSRQGQAPDGDAPKEFRLSAPGAGSDYVAFIHHAGIASLNLGFGDEAPRGVYHSIYDSFTWYSRFADTDFLYGGALAQVMATVILRLAEAPLLPFEFTRFARTIGQYVEEISKLAEKKSGRVDLAEVLAALAEVRASAGEFEAQWKKSLGRASGAPAEKLARINETLYRSERTLALAEGLPGRDWYKHQMYAPGVYTGYSAKTLPGIREAVEAGRWEEASEQAEKVVRVLRNLNAQIREATALLKAL